MATNGDVMKTLLRMGCPPHRLMSVTVDALMRINRDADEKPYLSHKGTRYYLDGTDAPEPTPTPNADAS